MEQIKTENGFEFDPTHEVIGIQNLLNKGMLSWTAGVGASYDLGGSFRVAVTGQYKGAINGLTNKKNRYANEQLSIAYYDVFDNMRMNNWEFSAHLLFPLKLIYSSS